MLTTIVVGIAAFVLGVVVAPSAKAKALTVLADVEAKLGALPAEAKAEVAKVLAEIRAKL